MATVDLQGGVHQQVEAGEEVSVRGGSLQGLTSTHLPLDRSEDRAGLGHVERLLVQVHGSVAGKGGARGGHFGELLGDVG